MDDYHQRTIIIGNKKINGGKGREKVLNINKPNSVNVNASKIEKNHDEGKELKTWGTVYGKAITNARINYNTKLSQSDLAKKINVKPEIVRDIENGKGLYNSQIASKLFRLLKVKKSK